LIVRTLVLSAVGRHDRCAREGREATGTASEIGVEWLSGVGGAMEMGSISREAQACARGKKRGSDLGAPPGKRGLRCGRSRARAVGGAGCRDPTMCGVYYSLFRPPVFFCVEPLFCFLLRLSR